MMRYRCVLRVWVTPSYYKIVLQPYYYTTSISATVMP